MQQSAVRPPIHLCFFGPLIGRHQGQVTTQELILSDLFSRDNRYRVSAVSSNLNRYLRLAEMVSTIVKERSRIDVGVLSVYGGPSIVVEETVTRLCRAFGIPLVAVLHGGALPEFSSRYPSWVSAILHRANVVVSPSSYLGDAMQRYCGSDIRVIPNVLFEKDYEFRQRIAARPNLLWMRSFHEIYNPLMAVDVVSVLRDRFPGVQLCMAGSDKGMLAVCKEHATALGLAKNVRFPGFLDRDSKILEARNADIFINTSRIDNMPVALLEAAAFGLPNVTTAVGGISKLFEHGRNALLAPSESVVEMVQQIEQVLSEPELCARLSEGGRQLAEKSFWTGVKPKWEQIFSELVGS